MNAGPSPPAQEPARALVAIGVSTGGLNALGAILPKLPAGYPLAVIVIQHVHPDSGMHLVEFLGSTCRLPVKEADEKESILPGVVYVAPPNYHLLVEQDRTLSLSIEQRICYSRPSIDVLLESASDAYGASLVGVILTGANHDGSHGLRCVKQRGGTTLVQDPNHAEAPTMPQSAIQASPPDHILPLEEIGAFLAALGITIPPGSSPCNNP